MKHRKKSEIKQTVTSEMTEELLQQFPFIKEIYYKELYPKADISPHSHYLSFEEAQTEMMTYSGFEHYSEKEKKKYFKREKNILHFFQDLFDEYGKQLYLFEITDDVIHFQQIPFSKDFLKECIKSIREEQFIYLCISELNLVLAGTWDQENFLFYDGEQSQNLSRIEKIANRHHLYLLIRDT
jgi:hypothetical protein